MEINNREVILTINLEGCLGKTSSLGTRTLQLKHSRAYRGKDGYLYARGYEVKLKRHRKVIENCARTVTKTVRLNAEQVNYFVSFEARPDKHDYPREWNFWMRMKPLQRLDFYCRILAADDRAVSYNFEIV